MIQVTLRLKVPNSWFSEIVQKYSTPIKMLHYKKNGEGEGCSELVEIENSEDKIDGIVEEIKNHPDVCNVEVAPARKGSTLGAISTTRCATCSALNSSDCFLASSLADKEGDVEWKLITSSEKSLIDLMDKLEKRGVKAELVSKVNIDKDSLLTARQEQIIQVAYKRGYFDYPKRINIRELARIFGVSISTMSEILRKGEKKVIGSYFKEM